MKKLFVILIMFFALGVMFASAEAPATLVYGLIDDGEGNPVAGVDVSVTCTHDSVDTTKDVASNGAGNYYAFFSPLECDDGDYVKVYAELGQATGEDDGIVSYGDCQINTALVNVTIPELGVIGAGIALVGAIAGFAILRNRD
ncbi:TPA: hypothetical protein HA235_07390 [Candidatus Woesearchaeota archaeon]|nr:hypothetical protein [Candidatus Woesearchaeota archaeon]HIH32501.1 hypothetical protein [Candidatus Woesearchaeota archaeon]HIH55201.1 hypothetical protein [Candidatus Woesearchaeota archaeon]HIJ01494.1 hypothetical protein [Candidatus Woesearchaeota archaeon]HIJ13476.1 hypothetical protein [Candidatus Woesearchaeota archaeon]